MPVACSSFSSGDDVAVRSNWAVKRSFTLCAAVCAFFVVVFLHSGLAVLSGNAGWVTLTRGLAAEPGHAGADLRAAQGLFIRAGASRIASNTRYGWCLATVGLSDSDGGAECNWAAWKESPRGRVYLQAALLLAMRRVDQQELSTSSVDLESSQAKMTMARYEELAEIQKPDIEEILRLVAQDLIAGRAENLSFWQQQIRVHYPGQEYAWLHDIQNPFARITIAEKIDKLGQHSEAIHVGEQAVALNHWHWGHYVVAGFYLEEGQPVEAERHLLQAITYGGPDPLVTRYRVELAELYAGQHQIAAAQEQYCRAIQAMAAGSPDDSSWREKSGVWPVQALGHA